ncbi:hypothetical protein X735_09845 [Mesorhizobium sp. L2C085B000]|nr:hypothetical protein X735_09845 [Mesorhizobium sp. L2C085B000]
MFAVLLAEMIVDLMLGKLSPAAREAFRRGDLEAQAAFARQYSPALERRAVRLVRARALNELRSEGYSDAAIAAEMSRYAGNGWKRDRTKGDCPESYGWPAAMIWLAFMARPHPLTRQGVAEVLEMIEVARK